MKKEKTLFMLGLWVSILSFLGFPKVIKIILFVLTGFCIMFLTHYIMNHKNKKEEKSESNEIANEMKPFIDNINN